MVSGDRSNKIAITFKGDRCLYTRSPWTSCSLCVDSCPGEAIRVDKGNKSPHIDTSRCMQCGQCLSACPLEAFESASFSERQLLNRIEGEGSIRLRCFLPHGEHALLGAGVNTYQLGTCLAALTPGVLFELSLSRTCELSTDQCHQCALFPRVSQTMRCNETSAFLMLSDWGRANSLKETAALFLPNTCTDTVLTNELNPENTIERLDSTRVMRSSIRSLFHGRQKRTAKTKTPLPLKARKRYVPTWRMRLKDRWERRGDAIDVMCPWPVHVVDENVCKACGVCMQLCPTGSIHHTLDDGTFTFSFVPGTCVNCGLCIMSCTARALSRDYRPVEFPFDDMECYSREATPCVRCGLPVLGDREEQNCHLCGSEPDPCTLAERVNVQMETIVGADKDKKGRDNQ